MMKRGIYVTSGKVKNIVQGVSDYESYTIAHVQKRTLTL